MHVVVRMASVGAGAGRVAGKGIGCAACRDRCRSRGLVRDTNGRLGGAI